MNVPTNRATSVPELHALASDYEEYRGWPRSYPHSPMIDETFSLTAPDAVALHAFKRAWLAAKTATSPDLARMQAMTACAKALLGDLAPEVEHAVDGFSGRSDASTYDSGSHVITLRGRLSIITFLHELTHARGFGEHGAVWWSVNAFRIVWPRAYAKLVNVPGTHVLRQGV